MTSEAGTQNQINPCTTTTRILSARSPEGKENRPHFENVVDNEVTADDDEQERHVDPSEQPELTSQLGSLQICDERDESNHVQTEGDESMVLRK